MNIEVSLSKILKEVGELSADFSVAPSHTLTNDLGIDSLKLIDVVLSVEREFGVELSEAAIAKSKTVSELMAEIGRAVGVH